MGRVVNRFERRLVILRAKRNGCFDADQYLLERAVRTRAARKIRALLRQMRPIVLQTPRWSSPARFLDDVAGDLAVSAGTLEARMFEAHGAKGGDGRALWAFMISAFIDLCEVELDGPLHTAVDRRGFRQVLREVFERAQHGPPRALMLVGVEQMALEARSDLVQAFEEHARTAGADRRVNLLLAGTSTAGVSLEGAARLSLPDYGKLEAIEALVEYFGPVELSPLEAAAVQTGGVPAFIDAIGTQAGGAGLPTDPDELWRALGPLADDVRSVVDIAAADPAVADRLEALSAGPGTRSAVDGGLLGSGLVREGDRLTHLRSPVLTPAD
jgi:hypothetical protein